MNAMLKQIDQCLSLLGTDEFIHPFLTLAQRLGAAQVMIFSYSDTKATCLASRNFARDRLGKQLAALYLDGWFRKDPLLAEVQAMQEGEVIVRDMEELIDRMPEDYRRIFFDEPGLRRKSAILSRGSRCRLVVNLYQGPEDRLVADEGLLPLLGRLAHLHFDRTPSFNYPPPLTVLSQQERAVCLGVLEGKKTETIAGDMDIAPSSVTTYRRRAYEKLGISSRGSLFQLCK